jgi:hypothetical protein
VSVASMPSAAVSASMAVADHHDFSIRSNYWTMEMRERMGMTTSMVTTSMVTPCTCKLPSNGQKCECYENLRSSQNKL